LKRWGQIAVAGLLFAVVAVITWQVAARPEPVYQGKRLRQYLDQMAKDYPYAVDNPGVRAVYQMGPDAVPYLRRALRKKDTLYVKALVFLRAKLPLTLSRRLPDPKIEHLRMVSMSAAHCLAVFGPLAKEALPELIDCLRDVRSMNSAYGAILRIGPRPEDLPALLSLMAGTNTSASGYAAVCIGQIGLTNSEVLAALIAAAKSGPQFTRNSAISALCALGPKAPSALPVLARNQSDSDSTIRTASAVAAWLIQGGTNAPVAFLAKELENELDHGSPPSTVPNCMGPHEMTLLGILGFYQKIGSQALPAVPLLRRVRNDTNVWLRITAVEALWAINRETNDLVPTCLEALKYFDPGVQAIGADLLDQFCVERRVTLPELHEMFASSDTAVQLHAAHALWTVTGETDKTIPILVSCLSDHFRYAQNKEIRRLAAETLGQMGARARPAVPPLVVALSDGEQQVRTAATNALRQIKGEARVR
jgi:HEAT repeat protein